MKNALLYLNKMLKDGGWFDKFAISLLTRPKIMEGMADGLGYYPRIFGDRSRLIISDSAVVYNALFNLYSGFITIEDDVFFGHNVSILTGTHDINKFGIARQNSIPPAGSDIVIERGAWIASNVTVIGPCVIGRHAVVCTGAVVIRDVPSYAVVAGVPAVVLKSLSP